MNRYSRDQTPGSARVASGAASVPGPRIRPYTPADRDAVRAIAVTTALRGQGAGACFDDPELIADYLCGYYTDHQPADTWVADAGGQVVGYCFGCRDSADCNRFLARDLGPRVIRTAARRLVTGGYAGRPQNRRLLWWLLRHAWREPPRFPYERLPAHYHCNLLPPGQGHRLYTALVLTCLERLGQAGVQGIHAQVTEPAAAGPFHRMARAFLQAHPEVAFVYAETPSTMYRRVLGDPRPMMNRAWGGDLNDYVAFIRWVREHYRI